MPGHGPGQLSLGLLFQEAHDAGMGGLRIPGNRQNTGIAGVKAGNPALPFKGDETVFALVLDRLAVLEPGHFGQVLQAGRNPVDALGCKGGGGIDLAGRGGYGDRLAAPLREELLEATLLSPAREWTLVLVTQDEALAARCEQVLRLVQAKQET